MLKYNYCCHLQTFKFTVLHRKRKKIVMHIIIFLIKMQNYSYLLEIRNISFSG